MKLLVLYGAPAVGKLTIANKLAEISGVHIFDNHQIIDVIEPLVTRTYPGFTSLVYKVQRELLEAAATANQRDVVTTFAYAANEQADGAFLTQIIESTRKLGQQYIQYCSTRSLKHCARGSLSDRVKPMEKRPA